MERFRTLLKNHHQYARDWKARTGGKVLGYYCPYMTEEIAYAAGILPVRLLAHHEPDDISDRYMYGNCRPSRDIFVQFMKGRYDYLDGVVYSEGCQWMRHSFSSLLAHKAPDYNHTVFVPDYVEGHRAKTLLQAELKVFQTSLEKWTEKLITEEALDEAIQVYNLNRTLMRQVYELRRLPNPPISGSQAMEMVLASQVMDKAEHNRLLEQALKGLPQKPERAKPRARLMLVGSETHNAEIEKLVDSLGATVVIDELCNGSSYFWNEVIPQPDRLMALSLRYLDKPRCPLKDINYPRRPERIASLAEDYNVQGVIISKRKYCHPHGTDMPEVWKICRARNLPFYHYESDDTLPNEEARTGLEAFINSVETERI